MEAVEVKKILTLVPELLEVPYSRVWTAYDIRCKHITLIK
jgi:hypothetical protein